MNTENTSNIIVIGSDHAGFELKEELKSWLIEEGHTVQDLGTHSTESVDYPDYGKAVGEAVDSGAAGKGIVVCGTGIGISIAANRIKGVRAALCRSGFEARLAREHNDANVLALGQRITATEAAKDCVEEFLKTPFGGDRHVKRVALLGA
ncbi:MAG: ribose 5-phosphate isomerase B [Gammaproteobacteria bacterium]